jgi:branched-chain amino acid transport system substrate-binding protein
MKRAVLTAVAALAVTAGAGTAHADIQIGMQGPITGPEAAGGEQLRRGFEQAIADINASGGVLGQKLVGTLGDDACDPKQAVATANKFATDGVVFVDGGYCSGSSIPASSVYNDAGILQITPASTAVALTDDAFKKGWNNVYRTCGRNDQQGQVAGAYIVKTFPGKAVAIVDDKSAYGKGLADVTRGVINGLGVKQAMDEEITAGDKDFTALISRMKAANIGVIYYGGYQTEAGLITRQAHDQGLNAVLISDDALPSQDFWQITGPAGNGTLFTFSPDPYANPGTKAVVAEFTKAGFKPDGFTLYSYAAVQVFAEAAQQAGSTKIADIAKVLHSGTFPTILGPFKFDQKGDPIGSNYVVWQWENGSYHVL